MRKWQFIVNSPKLSYSQRHTHAVASGLEVAVGEWLVLNSVQHLIRPTIGVSAITDINTVAAEMVRPVLSSTRRTDIDSARMLTRPSSGGFAAITGGFLGTSPQASAIVGVAGQVVSTGPYTFADAGSPFTGATVDDYLYIAAGPNAGVYPLTGVTIAANLLTFPTAVFAADEGPGIAWVFLKAVAVPYVSGAAVRVGLFQDLDDPTIVRSGIILDGLAAVPVDGVTPGAVVGIGPIVGSCLNSVERITGVGADDGYDVLSIWVK